MSSQLNVKRRFINGRDDWRYEKEKAPVNTEGDQFVLGQKSFYDPVRFYNNVICDGKYEGDGSLLTNVFSNDNTKVPLAGGVMSGTLGVPLIQFPNLTTQSTAYKSLTPGTFLNSNIVVNNLGQISSISTGSGGGGGGGTATNANIIALPSDNTWYYPVVVLGDGTALTLYCDDITPFPFRYNPSTGLTESAEFVATTSITAPIITATGLTEPNLIGTASRSQTIKCEQHSTPGVHYLTFVDGGGAYQTLKHDSDLKYDGSTNVLTVQNLVPTNVGLTGTALINFKATQNLFSFLPYCNTSDGDANQFITKQYVTTQLNNYVPTFGDTNISGTKTFTTAAPQSSQDPSVANSLTRKSWVEGQIATGLNTCVRNTGDESIVGIKTFTSVPVCTTPASTGFQLANLNTVTSTIAADTSLVKTTGAQTIAGTKTFTSPLQVQTTTASPVRPLHIGYPGGAEGWKHIFMGVYESYNPLNETWTNTGNSLAIGLNAGLGIPFNTNVSNNIAIGRAALGGFHNGVIKAGSSNICLGVEAGWKLDAAAGNVLLGTTAGQSASSGSNNTCVGNGAGQTITTGSSNTCIGHLAGARITTNTTGFNVFVGGLAGGNAATAIISEHNIGIGHQSLGTLTSGTGNIAIGYSAGRGIETESNTIVIGYNSAKAVNITSNPNVYSPLLVIGSDSCTDNVVTGNTISVFGHYSGRALTSATNTLIVGNNSGNSIITTQSNTIIGHNCFQTANTAGNTIVGFNSGNSAIGTHSTLFGNAVANSCTGAYNTIIGRGSASNLTNGEANVVIGCNSASDLLTGSNNILIGGASAALNLGTSGNSDEVRLGRPNLAKLHIQGAIMHNIASFQFTGVTTALTVMASFIHYRISTATTILTIPAPSAVYEGMEIIFRKQIGAFQLTVTTAGGAGVFYPLASGASASATAVISATQFNMRLICSYDPANVGQYFWYQTLLS